ncbi:MAG: pyruvate kinase [Flavobacteriaceae bacterium]|nr:pyruvate kinase [Flavobacteriaceae bacterium]
MQERKKTKILATLGPATASKEVLRKMMLAGADLFRINFSHADYDAVRERVEMIRELNEELGHNTGILADLQGPKLRVGVMEDGIEVAPGDQIAFKTGEKFVGNKEAVYMTYPEFPRDVKPGERVLLDDGKLIFRVVETNGTDTVVAEVEQGGPLKSKKGVNLPNTNISLPALTPKDIEDAIFAISLQVDWLALSFVRHAQDIKDLQQLIAKYSDYKIPIISKIEKPEAITNIDEIVALSDGIMVARGDLGVEVPAEEVPLLQKQLVLKSKEARIPVVIATQMMETMMDSLTPTRAEVNDVGNSVMDGADAVMLSGETSVGQYPVEVVAKMASIIRAVENVDTFCAQTKLSLIRTNRFISKAVCHHAALLANEVEAKTIMTLTNSGYTAFQVSSWRPRSFILAFTDNRRILGRLNLLWGVYAHYYDGYASTDETIEDIINIAKENEYLKKGDMTITLTSMPIEKKGMVNSLRVTEVD